MQVKAIAKLLAFALLAFFSALPAQAQFDNLLFRLKPAEQKAVLFYQAGAYEQAIPYLESVVAKKAALPLQLMLAHAYALTGDERKAVDHYRQVIKVQPLEPKHLLTYTLALQTLGREEEARNNFQAYLLQMGDTTQVAADLGRADLYKSAIRYSVHPLSINSRQNEFAPVLIQEGMLFASDRNTSGISQRNFSRHASHLDLYASQKRSNTRFVHTKPLNNTVNTKLHEGPAALDSAGNLYFSRSARNGTLSLWQASKRAKSINWSKAKPVVIPGAGNAFHPAISEDGQLLYFTSDMAGGFGGTDIYYSRLEDGGWSAPVNVGAKVNTPGNEAFPVIRENKLFFSSDGRIGLGGMDMYEAYISGNKVLYVRNLGAPANSDGDDFGLIWSPDGSGGYFASNRKGGKGGDDLYRIDYHIITLEGILLDSTNHQPLAGASVALQNPDGTTRQATTTEKGAYQFTLFPGESYSLSFSAKSYRAHTVRYSTLQGKQYGKRALRTSLERKTRIFVVGNVRLPDRKKAAQAQVIVYEKGEAQADTLRTNERGGFEAELDTDATYTFLASCDALGSVTEFTTSSRSEASLSHYLTLELTPQQQYQVEGKIAGATAAAPLVIQLTNTLNGETILLWPEGNKFSFSAISTAGYELCLQQGTKTAFLYLDEGWQTEQREVLLQLK